VRQHQARRRRGISSPQGPEHSPVEGEVAPIGRLVHVRAGHDLLDHEIGHHEFYLHPGVNTWRLFNYRPPFFRAKYVYTLWREDYERGGHLGERLRLHGGGG
jgi:hypothetical protein